jgi:hypothetical protein
MKEKTMTPELTFPATPSGLTPPWKPMEETPVFEQFADDLGGTDEDLDKFFADLPSPEEDEELEKTMIM